jgi:glycine/D-amino acid oxidase-like deaminating enzyme
VQSRRADIAIIGAGIVGVACAYYLALRCGGRGIALIDPLTPMSLTSAASGENYRNWWPHPVMTAFTDYSIDLLEQIARQSQNRIHMTRRGYALATRLADPDALLRQLRDGYGPEGAARIRVHAEGSAATYTPALSPAWEAAPDGVDVIQSRDLIRQHFPSFDPAVATIVHIRRAGHISGQQLGSLMLEHLRAGGATLVPARVMEIERRDGFVLKLAGRDGTETLHAASVVNAAGPHLAEIAAMLGERLPVTNIFQQKIAFADTARAIDRRMPFAIDLDGQEIDWTEQERAILREDPATTWLAALMPGGIHCRPEGGDTGTWIKLGWAYNRTSSAPRNDPPTDPNFPEVVLRGAARLNPALKIYYGRLPRQMSHYGGYYTLTQENWPLIGPMRTEGAFVAGALSGFGTMAACASGALCAAWIAGDPLPPFAAPLSLARHDDSALMQKLLTAASTGIL